MKDITSNEMNFVLTLLKSPEVEYNATSIAKPLHISPMGALKIAKKLEKERIITGKNKGKARFYALNLEEEYVEQYVRFLLHREVAQALPYIRVWIRELKKLKHADVLILFGSVLRKQEAARDIDVVAIITKKTFETVKKEVAGVDAINRKKLHLLYQTKQDFKDNIKKLDSVLLNAIKGLVVKGENVILEALKA